MDNFEININPEALRYAIESSGNTVRTLVAGIPETRRFTENYLNDILNKKRKIYYGDLKKINKFLKRGIPFFMLENFPKDKTLKNFRTKNKNFKLPHKIELKIRDYDLLREEIKLLMKNANINIKDKALGYSTKNKPEEIAEEFRKDFDFKNLNDEKKESKEVFEYLRNKIENYGVYVFKDSLSENFVRGLILLGNDLPPLILINSNDDKNAEIFSLLHEFAHYLLGDDEIDLDIHEAKYNKDLENWCNSFAYFFIMNKDIEKKEKFIKENKKILLDSNNLKELSIKYNISKHALMYRFYLLNIISLEEYNNFKNKFPFKSKEKKESKGGDYYNTIRSRISRNFIKLVYNNYSEGNISIKDTLDYLKVKEPVHIDFMMEATKQ